MEDTKTEDKRLIEEMVRDAEKAKEPGEMKPIIHPGGEGIPPMVTMKLESAGYSILYNTRTGEHSVFNNNMLRGKLQQRWEDNPLIGRFKWASSPVKNSPNPTIKGTFKCLLHRDDPDRNHYDTLGFAVCPKDKLSAPFHVRRHMQKRHKVEWEAIEEERKDREKKEDREFQRSLIGKAVEKAPLYVSKKDRTKQETRKDV